MLRRKPSTIPDRGNNAGSRRRTIHASAAAATGLAGMMLLLLTPSSGHDIITTQLTYSRDISRIFAVRCLSCHGEHDAIPLTDYQQVRPWAVDIKEQVLSRAMPPWGAVKGFGDFDPDGALTQEEILIVSAWVVGGAPQGDLGLLPKPKVPAFLPPISHLRDAVTIAGHSVLSQNILVAGIRPDPSTPVDSARITARLPDGRITALLWLYHYNPQWKRVFRFRRELSLPHGTVVESSPNVRFVLEVSP